jgi:maleate isomerase
MLPGISVLVLTAVVLLRNYLIRHLGIPNWSTGGFSDGKADSDGRRSTRRRLTHHNNRSVRPNPLPTVNLRVDLTTAEAVARSVQSIRRDGSLDHDALNTIVWLEQHQKALLQPHFGEAPQPREALNEVYGVRAQTLGPIVCGDEMAGWISIHSLR